jgi:ATP-dependent Clp protease adaptor protein ClpS
MAQPSLPVPDTHHDTSPESREQKAPVYIVIVWNDPVNLMQYVTHVFQRIFGWDRQTAERHMLEVHTQGRSTVARDSMEKAELYVHQLQSFSLHATMERE